MSVAPQVLTRSPTQAGGALKGTHKGAGRVLRVAAACASSCGRGVARPPGARTVIDVNLGQPSLLTKEKRGNTKTKNPNPLVGESDNFGCCFPGDRTFSLDRKIPIIHGDTSC